MPFSDNLIMFLFISRSTACVGRKLALWYVIIF